MLIMHYIYFLKYEQIDLSPRWTLSATHRGCESYSSIVIWIRVYHLIYLVGLDYILISNWIVKLNVLNASSSELHNSIYLS